MKGLLKTYVFLEEGKNKCSTQECYDIYRLIISLQQISYDTQLVIKSKMHISKLHVVLLIDYRLVAFNAF